MQNENNLISVVVPAYNVEKYIEKCVDSLLQQELDCKYEIILVDDGSTDGTSSLIDSFAENNKNIYAYHKSNGGLSSARNYGILHSSGNLITFVDSDDYVSRTYLKDMLYLLQKYDADMSITKVVLRTPGQELRSVFSDFLVDRKEALYEVYCNDRISWLAVGKLYKREVFADVLFPDGYYEDQASSYKFIDKCDKVSIGDYRNNYYYIQRDGSISFSKFNPKHLRAFEICEEFSDYVKKTYPDMFYIVIMTCQKSVQLLLNRLVTTREEFNRIYYKYRGMFRSNAGSILKNSRIPTRSKIYYIVMCSTPFIYKLFSGSIQMLGTLKRKLMSYRQRQDG